VCVDRVVVVDVVVGSICGIGHVAEARGGESNQQSIRAKVQREKPCIMPPLVEPQCLPQHGTTTLAKVAVAYRLRIGTDEQHRKAIQN